MKLANLSTPGQCAIEDLVDLVDIVHFDQLGFLSPPNQRAIVDHVHHQNAVGFDNLLNF